jgi:tripartite ATP-independent transporter DctM subunit
VIASGTLATRRPAAGLAALENGLVAAIFGLTVALPIAEILMRALLRTGIEGVGAIVQHLTLALGMFGAAAAARDQRLLSLAFAGFIRGRAAVLAQFAARTIAAGVTVLLLFAAVDFVAAERRSASTLVYDVPVWIGELPLVAGYGLIAWRLFLQSSATLPGRALAAVLIGAAVLWLRSLGAEAMGAIALPAVVLVVAAALVGAPIFALVGGAALFLLVGRGVPAAAVAVDHYSLVVNSSLPAIPMFTLAGYLLAESKAPQRLIEVFDVIFGRLRGGAAIVTVLACTFFTSFTGASGVTVLALGGLALPLLLSSGYAEKRALGLVTAAGLPGTLLLPSLPLILYAIIAGVAIEDMFIAGVLPTVLMAAIVTAWAMWNRPAERPARPWDPARVRAALAAAKWELSVPAVPIAALASGLATPVEAAALTAAYVLVVVVGVHRDLSFTRDVPRVMAECGLIIGGILLIMGVALGLTDYLVDAEVPGNLAAWAQQTIGNRWLFLLALNAFLLLAGCVVEIYPAIMVLVPILVPIGKAFGMDPVHLGIIFLANMELGYLTPLVGLNLFFAAYRFGKPVMVLFRAVLPLFVALAVGVLLVTYVPWLSTGILSLTKGRI